MRLKSSLLSLLSLASLLARADLVHVIEQTEVGGVTNVVRDTTKLTGMPWATAAAPTVAGHLLAHRNGQESVRGEERTAQLHYE